MSAIECYGADGMSGVGAQVPILTSFKLDLAAPDIFDRDTLKIYHLSSLSFGVLI